MRVSSILLARHSWAFRDDSLAISLLWGTWEKGFIAFDYGAKTYRFGESLDEAEARQIVALIHQRFPHYR